MAIEISIIDNTTYVSIEFANVVSERGVKSVDLPKNECVLEVVGDCLNVCCGMKMLMIDYKTVVLPEGPFENAGELRDAIKAFFYK